MYQAKGEDSDAEEDEDSEAHMFGYIQPGELITGEYLVRGWGLSLAPALGLEGSQTEGVPPSHLSGRPRVHLFLSLQANVNIYCAPPSFSTHILSPSSRTASLLQSI